MSAYKSWEEAKARARRACSRRIAETGGTAEDLRELLEELGLINADRSVAPLDPAGNQASLRSGDSS